MRFPLLKNITSKRQWKIAKTPINSNYLLHFTCIMKEGLFNKLNLLKNVRKIIRNQAGTYRGKPPWNVLFFGADEFSVYSLKALYSEYINGTVLKNLEIATTTKGKRNPVRKFAEEHKLFIRSWPVDVPNNAFDVGVVVSFGHLIPEIVIEKFPLGMLNVHASLLPRWRGAAPIIYALANGDAETGVTIMRIRPKHFDIGEILMQERVPISNDVKMPELYEKLGGLGAKCLTDCLRDLPERLSRAKPQPSEGVTFAPKITPDFATVSWESMCSSEIYNRERALTGLLSLTSTWNGTPVKLAGVRDCGFCNSVFDKSENVFHKPGFVQYDKSRKVLIITCAKRACVSVEKIGVSGKKTMSAADFYNGYISKEPLYNRCFK